MPEIAEVKLELPHDRLDIYNVAQELDVVIVDAARRAPKGHGWLIDQVQRASESMVLNLVEGNGRTGADRKQHFKISRGSAYELDAGLELMSHRALLAPLERRAAKILLCRFVAMLTKLMQV